MLSGLLLSRNYSTPLLSSLKTVSSTPTVLPNKIDSSKSAQDLLRFSRKKSGSYMNTVQMFLEDTKEEWFRQADKYITEKCICYLSLTDFAKASELSELALRNRRYPFLRYAALNFGVHATRCSDSDPEVEKACMEFIKSGDSRPMPIGSFQMVVTRVLHFVRPDRIESLLCPPLHMAISCGLVGVVKSMIAKGANLEERGHKMETPLHLAARSSSKVMVQMLLEKGAKTDAINYSGESALDTVMVGPYQNVSIVVVMMSIYKTLMRAFVAVKGYGQDHLYRDLQAAMDASKDSAAMEHVQRSIFRRILAKGLVVDITQEAEEVANLLIDHGADVNSLSYAETSPLQLAALYERPLIAQRLLAKGANPFLQRDVNMTAWDIAKARGNHVMTKLLGEKMEKLEKQEAEIVDPAGKLGRLTSQFVRNNVANRGEDLAGPSQARDIEERANSCAARKVRYGARIEFREPCKLQNSTLYILH